MISTRRAHLQLLGAGVLWNAGCALRGKPSTSAGWTDLMAEPALSGWTGMDGADTGEWLEVKEVALDPADDRRLVFVPGAGILLNSTHGKSRNLFARSEHGDVEAHIEFLIPRASNSGVYFQSRYELQILDSWGVAKPTYTDCGGIYQRYIEETQHGFEGHAPRVNASRKFGEWQTFDVQFRAPRFDARGAKVENARFVRVMHNGVLIHENVVVNGPTRNPAWADERPLGPLRLQGDHGWVAFRKIQLRPWQG